MGRFMAGLKAGMAGGAGGGAGAAVFDGAAELGLWGRIARI